MLLDRQDPRPLTRRGFRRVGWQRARRVPTGMWGRRVGAKPLAALLVAREYVEVDWLSAPGGCVCLCVSALGPESTSPPLRHSKHYNAPDLRRLVKLALVLHLGRHGYGFSADLEPIESKRKT